MKLSGMIAALIASGGTVEQIQAVVQAAEAEQEERAARAIPWQRLRELVLHRDGRLCRYCGEDAGPSWHCDHIIPRSRGGENVLSNVAVACERCNTSKKDRTPDEWGGP